MTTLKEPKDRMSEFHGVLTHLVGFLYCMNVSVFVSLQPIEDDNLFFTVEVTKSPGRSQLQLCLNMAVQHYRWSNEISVKLSLKDLCGIDKQQHLIQQLLLLLLALSILLVK